MLHALLIVLCFLTVDLPPAISARECDPTRYLCSGQCPPMPKGVEPPSSEAFCSKDPESDTCICWLLNPSSQLHTLFQCEARVNGSVSKVTCAPPKQCFSPHPQPGCLIVLHCPCILFEHRYEMQNSDPWKRVKAIVHTRKKIDLNNQDGHSIEKIQGVVREFSLKHLLFLLGFVIAPLLCWCLLNFFHEGKCRKKPPQPPEARPIPTSRSSTVDNMNNEEGEQSSDDPPVLLDTTPSRAVSPQPFSIQLPSAPEDLNGSAIPGVQQTLMKCESPPPYSESVDRSFQMECGPPPAYDDVIRVSEGANIQQMWQTVFIVRPEVRENV